VSAAPTGSSDTSTAGVVDPAVGRPARAGFVVSSAVGNSVVRHRVSRRLREQVRPLLTGLPAGTDVVVRAFPAAATATSAQLGRDLRSALQRVRSR
jgi:ribonuclease P protein component